MSQPNHSSEDVTTYVKIALVGEDLIDLSVKILEYSTKGYGNAGDMIFVDAKGSSNEGSPKEYNLVLKCGKQSEALREKVPIRELFLNEIVIYDKIFPLFNLFQFRQNVESLFNSVPKCYGTFTDNCKEILVLENLKKSNYELWDNKKPLPRSHIDMVVKEYGKLHAISVAMKEQRPEEFEILVVGLRDVFQKNLESSDVVTSFENLVVEIHDMLRGDLDESILDQWQNCKQNVHDIFHDLSQNTEGLNVITHGDCWNNNFMFQYPTDNKDLPSKVCILDWQLARVGSPILDLSYFLFACISQEDIEDMNIILKSYFESFSNFLKILGTESDKVYTFKQFLQDWKNYSKCGVLNALLPIKLAFCEKEEIPDLAQIAASGKEVTTAFVVEVKDKTSFKNRMNYIVKHVIQNALM